MAPSDALVEFLARSGFGKQYVRGTLIEQKVVAGGLLGVSLLLPPKPPPHAHPDRELYQARERTWVVAFTQHFLFVVLHMKVSFGHWDQCCLERKGPEIWMPKDLGSVKSLNLSNKDPGKNTAQCSLLTAFPYMLSLAERAGENFKRDTRVWQAVTSSSLGTGSVPLSFTCVWPLVGPGMGGGAIRSNTLFLEASWVLTNASNYK